MAAAEPKAAEKFLKKFDKQQLDLLYNDWGEWGRPDQQVPEGEWYIWLLLTGRGWGKTRTESEAAHQFADACPGSRGALVARTTADARDTMVLGLSGVLATQKPWNPVQYFPSSRLLKWKNGTEAHTFSSEEPDQLRGPNHHWAVCDEWATWTAQKAADGGTAWDHVQYSTRLKYREGGVSHPPRIIVATTPRPTKAMRALLEDPRVRVTTGSMLANRANLAPQFLRAILKKYSGTRLGRQEIEGVVLELVEDALVEAEWIHNNRLPEAKDLQRVVVGVDPAGSSGDAADLTGIIVAGHDVLDHGHILADRSCSLSPALWGRRAIDAYHEFGADCIVAEKNYGGEMVANTITTVDRNVTVNLVTASRAKHIRFEPVAGLYEQGRIHHIGEFVELEDQVLLFNLDGYAGDDSPDRADALVWAISELMLGYMVEPLPDMELTDNSRESHWRGE